MAIAAGPESYGPKPSRSGGGQGKDPPRRAAGSSRDKRPKPRWLTAVPAREINRGDGQFVTEFIQGDGTEVGLRIPVDSFAGPAGDPFVLRRWQADIVNRVFARTDDGRRRFRIALIGMPRKNGKTGLMAGLALDGLVNEGVGGEVYSVAGDKDQAKLVFSAAKRMVQLDPDLTSETKLYRDAIEHLPTQSVYRPVSSVSDLKEGLSPTRIVVDEVHVIEEDLWNVFALAMGARPEPIMLGITTAGVKNDRHGQPTIAYRLYNYGVALATGQKVDPSFYFEWWGAPESLDHRLESTWRLGNPGYDDILDPRDLLTTLATTHENEFRTKRLNQWTETITAWLPHGAWDGVEDAARSFDETDPFVAFLDGSWANDSTGVVAESIKDPHLSVLGHWTPDAQLGHIDMDAVETRVRQVLAMPGCRELAFDPARFQDLFSRLESEFNDDRTTRIVQWPTNSLARMVPACQEFYASVIEKRLTHDGDQRLAAHIGNAVLKEDRHGPRIVKESKNSTRKIDLAVCAVGAHDRARWHATQKPTVSIYERHPDWKPPAMDWED